MSDRRSVVLTDNPTIAAAYARFRRPVVMGGQSVGKIRAICATLSAVQAQEMDSQARLDRAEQRLKHLEAETRILARHAAEGQRLAYDRLGVDEDLWPEAAE